MQISPIKNQNFEKPSRNPSNRTKVKILKKKFLDISQKIFCSGYAQSPRKCSNIEHLQHLVEGLPDPWSEEDWHLVQFRYFNCIWCTKRTEFFENIRNTNRYILNAGGRFFFLPSDPPFLKLTRKVVSAAPWRDSQFSLLGTEETPIILEEEGLRFFSLLFLVKKENYTFPFE